MIARSQLIAAAGGVLQSSSRREAPAGEAGSYRQVDSITWYYELRGRGPAVVLIPSGEGDCGSFEKVAVALSGEFTVLTFDMPGFSRSSDPPAFGSYSMAQAASEVVALVRALGLPPATFYGCSSGVKLRCRSSPTTRRWCGTRSSMRFRSRPVRGPTWSHSRMQRLSGLVKTCSGTI
jgi:hypothetical protein